MKPSRQKASDLYEKLTNKGDGLSYQALLEYILNDYLDGQTAFEALQAAQKEFFYDDVEVYRSKDLDWDDDDYDDEGDDD